MRKNPAQAVFDLYSMVISDYERADCFKYLPKRVVILRKLEARVHQFPKDSPMYVAALCITLPELLDHPKRIAILRKLGAIINEDP